MEISRILERSAGSDIDCVKICPDKCGVCTLDADRDVCPLHVGPSWFGGADAGVQGTLAQGVHGLDSVITPSSINVNHKGDEEELGGEDGVPLPITCVLGLLISLPILLKWLIKEGCPYDKSWSLEAAVEGGERTRKVLEWLDDETSDKTSDETSDHIGGLLR